MEQEKKKKPRFSDKEIDVLVSRIKEKNEILFGRFSDVISNSKKREEWNYVAQGVNVVSFTVRTVDELKKKWDDMKRGTKKRASAVNNDRIKTGGGKPEVTPLSQMEEDVVAILGEERVFGLSTGMDTMEEKAPLIGSDAPQIATCLDMDKSQCFGKISKEPIDITGSRAPLMKKQRMTKTTPQSEDNESLRLQRQLVQIEQERLDIEKERLRIERRRLELEEK